MTLGWHLHKRNNFLSHTSLWKKPLDLTSVNTFLMPSAAQSLIWVILNKPLSPFCNNQYVSSPIFSIQVEKSICVNINVNITSAFYFYYLWVCSLLPHRSSFVHSNNLCPFILLNYYFFPIKLFEIHMSDWGLQIKLTALVWHSPGMVWIHLPCKRVASEFVDVHLPITANRIWLRWTQEIRTHQTF